MNPAELLLTRYRGKRVLLDANLLLLYLIGSFQRERVELFKRTEGFSLAEFDLLVVLLREFSTLVTTPHILTEVSNLANSLPGNIKQPWYSFFASQVAQYLEVYTPASELCSESCFNPFGIADASVQSIAADTLVLTDDFRLSGYFSNVGISTINFRDFAATL